MPQASPQLEAGILSSSRELIADSVEVLDTTEVRWFLDGPLPAEVTSWFTHRSTLGFVEERCDTYLVDGSSDRGVKWRHGMKLEVKERQSPPETLVFEGGLVGWLESWRRWSPGDDRVDVQAEHRTLQADKVAAKRRFSVTGEDIVVTADSRGFAGAGCDVEVATIRVDGQEVWTFAFASFGPIAGHRDSLITSWRALNSRAACPLPGSSFARSSGYPEFLAEL